LTDPQRAPTAITDITLMPALLTVTTVLAGSLAAYLSAPARGTAGDAGAGVVGVEVAGAMAEAGATVATVGASTVDAGSLADGASSVDAGSLVAEATRVVQSAGSAVDPFTAEVGSTVAAASMAEADSTVVVADTAAVEDTANLI
jgi:hypothetical protein